mgnify:CR=1 FL=1
MIDMMLNVINDIEKDKVEEDAEHDQYHQDMKFQHKKKRKMTEQDVISNLIVLLMVGYDTTGMTLAFILYALAENPEVQEKLQQEVDELRQTVATLAAEAGALRRPQKIQHAVYAPRAGGCATPRELENRRVF